LLLMPVHDWSRVAAGIFHHLHHSWIEEIQRALNSGLLPDTYYALAEQRAAGYGPDVLTLQVDQFDDQPAAAPLAASPHVGLSDMSGSFKVTSSPNDTAPLAGLSGRKRSFIIWKVDVGDRAMDENFPSGWTSQSGRCVA
jgi:hypothetical protein